ncbi:MAG: N-acetylmuramoyl-L-alanine amidase [Verrucomicrobiota bacterium JB023]|nr:N-acetylmuramoyl-L-alanine amidase [Verrucomicrobiota bacterium JB023]
MTALQSPLFRLVRFLLFLLLLGAGSSSAHLVKKGDTLYSIARANGVSVQRLMAVNGIKDPSRLQVGKRLTIPSASSSASTKKVGVKVAQSPSRASKALTIIIDPGHGGRDRGAVWGGVRESDLNLKVAHKLNWYLKRAGYRTVMTRTSDRYVSLSTRAAIANRYRNALFVSIHFNATRETWVRGGETFYASSGRGSYLASSIQRYLVSKCSVRNRGARFRGFSVLRNTHCPAVLVECGFISNASERARCKSNSFQDAAAQAILAGIQRYDRRY